MVHLSPFGFETRSALPHLSFCMNSTISLDISPKNLGVQVNSSKTPFDDDINILNIDIVAVAIIPSTDCVASNFNLDIGQSG